MSKSILRLLFAVNLVFFLSNFSLHSQTSIEQIIREHDTTKQSKIGTPYLDFEITSLDGVSISQEDLKGKVTFINFWFSTCGPCIIEFDELQDLYETYSSSPNFQFISITTDYPEIAKKSVEKYKLPYIVYSVEDKESRRLNLNSGFPTNIVIGPDGKILYAKTGGFYDKELVKQLFIPIRELIESNLSEIK